MHGEISHETRNHETSGFVFKKGPQLGFLGTLPKRGIGIEDVIEFQWGKPKLVAVVEIEAPSTYRDAVHSRAKQCIAEEVVVEQR